MLQHQEEGDGDTTLQDTPPSASSSSSNVLGEGTSNNLSVVPPQSKKRKCMAEKKSELLQKKGKCVNKSQDRRHCCYCKKTLARKQCWDGHYQRFHEYQPKVDFNQLEQVVESEDLFQGDVTTPQAEVS